MLPSTLLGNRTSKRHHHYQILLRQIGPGVIGIMLLFVAPWGEAAKVDPSFLTALSKFEEPMGVSFHAQINSTRTIEYVLFPDLYATTGGAFGLKRNPYENRIEECTVELSRKGEAVDYKNKRKRSGIPPAEWARYAELRYLWTKDDKWVAFSRSRQVDPNGAAGIAHVNVDSSMRDLQTAQGLPGRELLLGAYQGDLHPVTRLMGDFESGIQSAEQVEYAGRPSWSVLWEGDQGKYDVVFDAASGVVLHAVIEKTGDNAWYGTGGTMSNRSAMPLGNPESGEIARAQRLTILYETTAAESGSPFILSSAKVTSTTEYGEGRKTIMTEDIVLNTLLRSPDFDALGAFDIGTLPEGTIVVDPSLGTTDFEIRGGEIVPRMPSDVGALLEESVETILNECPTLTSVDKEEQVLSSEPVIAAAESEDWKNKRVVYGGGMGCILLAGSLFVAKQASRH